MARPGSDEREAARRAADTLPGHRFEDFVAGVRDYAVFTLDVDGHVTSWNEGAERIKGYRAHEIIGKHFSRFYPPESIATHLPEQELKTAAAQGRVEDEGWRLRKNGTRFWANVVITALRSPTGRLTGFLKITRDLTERRRQEEMLRESEDRFRLLVESVREYAIFMLDPEGNVMSWNRGAERIKGYTAAEIIGRNFSCFYPPEMVDNGIPQEELKRATEQGSLEVNGWRLRKDGSRFWADIVITAVYDREARLRGFAKVTRDLTERRQFEQLEESQQRTNEFLAMLSHELRNPLAPLKTSVDILRMREMHDPVVQRAHEVVGRQVQHLSRLIDDLLDVSRITSGRINLANEPVELATAISRAIEAARPLIDKRHHTLKVELPGRLVMVKGDLTRLTQVFLNLLNNAAKYTPESGHIEVLMSVSGGQAKVCVRDNGIGIEPELLSKVFELFVQGRQPLDRAEGGLGIGLALVHRIVSLHRGKVKAHSEGVGRGSEFVVTLPLAEEAYMSVVPGSEQGGERSARRRLLVVDDNKDAAESMSMLLELWGHEVVCAYDGRSALATAARYRPHAVFLDIGLPGMDGYEVAERLRELPGSEGAVLVAITGYGQDADRRRSREAGIDHHLVKPVAPETLHTLLNALDTH